MKFRKDALIDVLYNRQTEDGGLALIEINHISNSRWTAHQEMIFTDGESYWRVPFESALTELQSQSPFQYAVDDIEAEQVWPVEKRVRKFMRLPFMDDAGAVRTTEPL